MGMIGTPVMYQHMWTTNLRSGIPLRLYVFYTERARIAGVLIEHDAGNPPECSGLLQLPAIEITPKEYNFWVNHYRKGK
jgi:hypothetical protein